MLSKFKVLIVIITLLMCLNIVACGTSSMGNTETQTEPEETKEVELLEVSWSYRYSGIEEITDTSDVIGLIKITGINKTYTVSGIPLTEFNAEVITPLKGVKEKEEVIILQTGMETDTKIYEVSGDSLMQMNDEYLIFARKNSDGTLTVLGGPQGRLIYSNNVFNSLENAGSRTRSAGEEASMTLAVKDESKDELLNTIEEYIAN